LPWREQDCCLPEDAHRRLWVRLPGLILLSTTIHFSEFNDAACILASPLLRTPPFEDRPSVRLPTGWLAIGRVGLDGFRYLTHWVTLMSFKGYHPYSLFRIYLGTSIWFVGLSVHCFSRYSSISALTASSTAASQLVPPRFAQATSAKSFFGANQIAVMNVPLEPPWNKASPPAQSR